MLALGLGLGVGLGPSLGLGFLVMATVIVRWFAVVNFVVSAVLIRVDNEALCIITVLSS